MCSVLAGEGVQQWARQHGIPDCHPDDLITGGRGVGSHVTKGRGERRSHIIALYLPLKLVGLDRARQVYLDHKARLDGVTQLAGKRRRVEEEGGVVSSFLSTQGLIIRTVTDTLCFRTYRSV